MVLVKPWSHYHNFNADFQQQIVMVANLECLPTIHSSCEYLWSMNMEDIHTNINKNRAILLVMIIKQNSHIELELFYLLCDPPPPIV